MERNLLTNFNLKAADDESKIYGEFICDEESEADDGNEFDWDDLLPYNSWPVGMG